MLETPVRPHAANPATAPLDGLGQLLPRLAALRPDHVALITDTRSLTFAELDRESSRVARSLRDRGVDPGDRVSIFSQNRWEWIVAYHGALKAGAVVNPLNVMLTAEEVVFVLSDAGSSALLASGERLDAVGAALAEVASLRLVASFDDTVHAAEPFGDFLSLDDDPEFCPHPVEPEELACIAYTSGTTGHPKGAMQSHRSLVLNCAYTATMHARNSDDVVVTALPAPHVYGNVAINGTFLVGGTVVLMTRFDPAGALERISRYRATLFEGVPAMYALLLADPGLDGANLESLTRSTVGGQTIAESVIDAWEQRSGAPLIELWGMTELSGLGTTHAVHAPNVHGSIGVALPGIEIKVADPEDARRECATGEPGELLVRGPIVTMGYYNNPTASSETIEPDGWLHTGDIATRDGSGHLFVVDRLKDLIVTAGYNVYPAEIERVLIGHPAVSLVAVGREQDEIKGEVAHAYVILADGHVQDTEALLSHCRRYLSAYKVPRAIHYVEALPTTSSGKLMRRKLRDARAERRAGG
ncbi:fatty-acid--CoA ligase [Nocardioides sp. Root190]|uniref:class I adenylate-forming enzyme family protein n=1 Tax=Nocardioides sp. Root190 TaxID=1736488 RepID=UPI0006F89C52|nr:AMP-binding protein [Nocardioides sp. Root190]KRB75075.1 fatty-acid--CoA ligase [Nocardioides sp. Root190]